MVIKEKTREEVDSIYKWDLTKIYTTDDKWYEDYEQLKKIVPSILEKKGIIMNSANTLLETLDLDEQISRKLEKLYIYASLKSDEDTSNPFYQTMKGKIENINTEYSSLSSFIIPEILKENEEKVNSFIKENKELNEYSLSLKNIFRFKKYTLSEDEEKIISSLSKVINSPNKASGLIRNSDLKFGIIKDENNNDVELTNSNYIKYVSCDNRNVRKQAFKTLYKGYESMKNTLAETYATEVEANNKIALLKGYNSARERALYSNYIDTKIYDNLINTVNENLSVMDKYYALKKEVLDVDQLHMYDIYMDLVKDDKREYSFKEAKEIVKEALSVLGELHLYDVYTDLIKQSNKEYSFDEAKQIVLSALSILGNDYVANLNKAFDQKWIDVMPNAGKRNGAYSWGMYDTYPYVLLNYQGKMDDVSTLAHELGHSMHSYYSRQNNIYRYSGYRIFVAEVASTVNEILLSYYLLKNTTEKDIKLSVLDNLLEKFKGTLFRQTMFAEFEQNMHQLSQNGEILTHELLSNNYYELNKKYFGKNVVIDDEIRYEWARIPHFYMNFYVYQYATGISAAMFIAKKILDKDENMLTNYLKFLKIGGSMHPIESLKITSVDMEDKKVIEEAIKMFDSLIDEFKNTL